MAPQQRKNFSDADWDAIIQEMRAILIGLAKLRKTISYSDLAAHITSAYVHHRSPDFHRLLNDMSRFDEEAGRASLAPLVVRKTSNGDGIPGGGFFVNTPVEGGKSADLEAYWRTEFERTCDYWEDYE